MDIAARVEQARQAWNRGDLDSYLDLYDESIQYHGLGPTPMDKSSVVDSYKAIWSAFTEADKSSPTLEFHETLVDGALYSCRFTMTGVQTGEFMGHPASGRPFELAGITIMRFADDRVVERWTTSDFLGLLTQIGALPAMA